MSRSGLSQGQGYVKVRVMSRSGLCQVYVKFRVVSRLCQGQCEGQGYVNVRVVSRSDVSIVCQGLGGSDL